ncbi:MAG: flagellar motor switch protein FliN [Balneolaceae bacterium]
MENWKKSIQNFKPALEKLFEKLSGYGVVIESDNQDLMDVKQTSKALENLIIFKTIEEKFQTEALFGFSGDWVTSFNKLLKNLPDEESSEAGKIIFREITEGVSALISESLENTGIELRIDLFSEIESKKVKTVLNLQQYVVIKFKITFADKDFAPEFVFAVSLPNEEIAGQILESWDGKNQIADPGFSEIALNVANGMSLDNESDEAKGNIRVKNEEGTNVEFEPFDKSGDVKNQREIRNIDMLKDVDMQVSVELGRKRMPLGKILQLMKGSVIELEKLAGEPVDILVNGHCIAVGDVVVIDEHFGVRVTKLMAAHESMKKVS